MSKRYDIYIKESIKLLFKNKKTALLFLLLLFIWGAYEDFLIAGFDRYLLPFFEIQNSLIVKIIFPFLLLVLLYIIYKCIKEKYIFSFYLLFSFFYVSIIYLHYRMSGRYDYIYFLGQLSYSDILFLFIISFVIVGLILPLMLEEENKNNKEKQSFEVIRYIPDNPIYSREEDGLDYFSKAESISKYLETVPLNNPCSIGITSPWGTGKTSFLNLIEADLDKSKFIIVKFNPRYSKNYKNIQSDFFSELYSILAKYSGNFSTLLKDYMEAIKVIDSRNILSMLLNIQKIQDKDFEKYKLNQELQRIEKIHQKRVIIFIEDFDRLLAEEIIEIFKLIDGNASLTNFIFITAYDKDHINKILSPKYTNEDSMYSEKFFTLEIPIPLRPYSKILDYLKEKMFESLNIIREEDKNTYNQLILDRIHIIKNYLKNIRDVKRFLNMFLNDYEDVKNEVEFEDYFLLSLIKYKYPTEHLKIFKKELISQELFYEYFKLNNSDGGNLECLEILQILFPSPDNSDYTTINIPYRAVCRTQAFDIYFHNRVYFQLTIEEQMRIFDDALTIATSKIDKWNNEGNLQNFLEYISQKNILNFENKNQFKIYINILIYLNKLVNSYQTTFPVISLFIEDKELYKKYNFESKNEYRDFLKEIIIDKKELSYVISTMIRSYIKGEPRHEKLIFTKEELLVINEKYLTDYINEKPIMDNIHVKYLYNCISDIDSSNMIILNAEACLKFKDFIYRYPDYYINEFVRLEMYPIIEDDEDDFNAITCEPFWKQIFGDERKFKEFINSERVSEVKKIECVRNFWELYESNDYKSIRFEYKGNVKKKVDNNLVKEREQLKFINEIEDKYKSLIDSGLQREVMKNECKNFLEEINKINFFNIKKTQILYRTIKDKLESMS